MVKNLTQEQIQSIQIDEGVIYLDYGESTQRLLAPTRGGGEFVATVTLRDIEFDGRHGKTSGTQVIEGQDVTLKVTTIGLSQENLALAIPNCTVGNDAGKTISNPRGGIVESSSYLKNVTMFAKTIGGKYKKIVIYNAMHETGFTAKAVQKAEGELALEFSGHYSTDDLDGELWSVQEVNSYDGAPVFVSATTTTSTKISVTFSENLSSNGLSVNDFSVIEVSGSTVPKTVSAVALKSGDTKIVELTVGTLSSGTTVKVSYTKGTLKSANNVAVESFSNKPVTNTLT